MELHGNWARLTSGRAVSNEMTRTAVTNATRESAMRQVANCERIDFDTDVDFVLRCAIGLIMDGHVFDKRAGTGIQIARIGTHLS